MSKDHEGGEEENDFSFNELIDNILTEDVEKKHNDENHNIDENIHQDHDIDMDTVEHHEVSGNEPEIHRTHNISHDDHDDVDMPDFEAEQLVNAVASAMNDIDTNEKNMDDNTHKISDITNDEHELRHQNDDDEQHNEWARILQEGLMQNDSDHGIHSDDDHIVETHDLHDDTNLGTDNIQHTIDQLDRDDENLRLAILESLQNLDEGEEQPQEQPQSQLTTDEIPKDIHVESESKKEPTKKPVAKKTSKKKKKEKSKDKTTQTEKGSPKKKKSVKHKKAKDKTKDKEDDLDFNDVLQGLMSETGETAGNKTTQKSAKAGQDVDEDDADARAIVEETLKAFERELMGSSEEPSKTTTTKKAKKTTKQTAKDKSVTAKKPSKKTETTKKKKKKATKKADKSTEDNFQEDDDFSKALADMVNQVVSTSLGDESAAPKGEPSKKTKTKAKKKKTEKPQPINIPTWNHTQITPHQDESRAEVITTPANDEAFDLNQIMQNAIAMAFQEQDEDNFNASAMEEFNRSLGNFSVSDMTPAGKSAAKKKTAKKKELKKKKKPTKPKVAKERKIVLQKVVKEKKKKIKLPKPPKKPKKPSKPKKTLEQIYRKKYKAIAKLAANEARIRNRIKRRANKSKQIEDRIKLRNEKRQKRKDEHQKRLEELKELTEIVAKGPPYPPDLRITKKGTPKRPYRRWTPEEMEKRAQMALEKSKKPIKIKKEKKKKPKKLKKIPLKTLRKIPLFNLVRGSSTPAASRLNDIEGTLSKINLPLISSLSKAELAKRGADQKFVLIKDDHLLHPPWSVPLHPPISLPVATMVLYSHSSHKHKHKHSKLRKEYALLNDPEFRNKILPRTLATVVTNLKAAAKARIANGAPPEEILKYLRVIMERTRRSIIKAFVDRVNEISETRGVKEESLSMEDRDKTMKKPKTLPTFSLSSINKISTEEEPIVITVKDEPTAVSLPPEKSVMDKAELQVASSDNGLSAGSVINVDASPEEITVTATADKPKPESGEKSTSNDLLEERILFLHGALLGRGLKRDIDGNVKEPIVNQLSTIAPPKEIIKINDEEPDLSENRNSLPQINTIPKINIMPLVQKRIPSRSNYIKVEQMVESLVKNGLEEESGENHPKLSSDLSKMISNTINGLLPKVKVGKKKPAQPRDPRLSILNLDDLVPPKSFTGTIVPEVKHEITMTVPRAPKLIDEPKRYIEDLEIKEIEKPKGFTEPKRRMNQGESLLNKYKFDLPDLSNVVGGKKALLRKVKELLTPEQLTVFNRELAKERKRKWRVHNAEKNWEIDFRARIKKKANELYGEDDSPEKDRFTREKLSIGVKDEEVYGKGISTINNGESTQENTPTQSRKSTTNMTDSEILNIIAVHLDRLDIARKVESEIQGYEKEHMKRKAELKAEAKARARAKAATTVKRRRIINK